MRIIFLALFTLLGVSLTNAVEAKSAAHVQPLAPHALAATEKLAKPAAAHSSKTSKRVTNHAAKAHTTTKRLSKSATRVKGRHAKRHGKRQMARPLSAALPEAMQYGVVSGDEHTYEGLLPGEGYTVAIPSFNNDKGRAECVELIKGLMDAPRTTQWQEGRRLLAAYEAIKPGTAIATFVRGRYPQGRRHGPHAAIFLRATEAGIYVLDQFANQIGVQQRFIPWHHPRDKHPSNNASAYSTVRW